MHAITINERFQYQKFTRDDSGNGRKYITPDGKIPSVTTILSATADKSYLDQWKKWVGEEKANKIKVNAGKGGTLMHTHLENHILGIDRPTAFTPIRKQYSDMADLIIANGLVNVSEIWGIEVPLYNPLLYVGTTDLVGIHNGVPAIMDYKTARKVRTEEMVHDYYCQGCAYAHAHNEMYGTDISKVVLFMATQTKQYQEFSIYGEQFEYYSEMFFDRVQQYYHLEYPTLRN